MKKLMIALAALATLSLASCGGSKSDEEGSTASKSEKDSTVYSVSPVAETIQGELGDYVKIVNREYKTTPGTSLPELQLEIECIKDVPDLTDKEATITFTWLDESGAPIETEDAYVTSDLKGIKTGATAILSVDLPMDKEKCKLIKNFKTSSKVTDRPVYEASSSDESSNNSSDDDANVSSYSSSLNDAIDEASRSYNRALDEASQAVNDAIDEAADEVYNSLW